MQIQGTILKGLVAI